MRTYYYEGHHSFFSDALDATSIHRVANMTVWLDHNIGCLITEIHDWRFVTVLSREPQIRYD
jgi:hypothetical protein